MAFKVCGVTDPAKVAGVATPAKVGGVASDYVSAQEPVQITATTDFPPTYGSRLIVRTSGGVPYVGYLYDSKARIFKGDGASPTSFAEQDAAHALTVGDINLSIAIKSDGATIGMIYHSSSTVVSYCEFSTATDLFGTPETVASTTATDSRGIALAYDASDKPHAVYMDKQTSLVAYYVNKVSGSWSSPLNLEATNKEVRFPDIAIDSDGLPIISYTCYSDSCVKAAKGNANNATAFTLQLLDDDGGNLYYGQTSLCVDSNGDHNVAYTNASVASKFIKLKKHVKADSWATWSAETVDANNEYRWLGMAINGTKRYIVAHHEPATLGIKEWTDNTGSWVGTDLDAGGYLPYVRWSYLNNPSYATYGIDYFYIDSLSGGKLWWCRVIL